jgi:uncharacterized iron-regulated protein
MLGGGCAGRGTTADSREGDGSTRFVLPDGRAAGEKELLALAGGADYILLGEQHDNPADHRAQAAFIDLIARKAPVRPLIGLEMLPRRYYDFSLAAFSKGQIPLDSLPEALNWRNTWGYDFALYRPVFETVRRHELKACGLNLPEAVRRSVSRKGMSGLSEAEKGELPARVIPPRAAQLEKLQEVFRMHGSMRERPSGAMAAANDPGAASRPGRTSEKARGTVPPGMRAALEKTAKPLRRKRPEADSGGAETAPQGLDRFILIQSLWDSTMAEQAVELRKFAHLRQRRQSPQAAPPAMIILAGAGHVEYGYGIASRIQELDPGARIALVLPFSGEAPEPDAADIYYRSEARSYNSYGFTFAVNPDGLFLVNVIARSRAEAAGMRAGDIITWAGDDPVRSPADLHKAALQAKRKGHPLRLILNRAGAALPVLLPETPMEREAP